MHALDLSNRLRQALKLSLINYVKYNDIVQRRRSPKAVVLSVNL